MKYEDFLNEYDAFSDWEYKFADLGNDSVTVIGGSANDSVKDFRGSGLDGKTMPIYAIDFSKGKEDRVNSPKHYTAGRTEAIDVIEDAITGSIDSKSGFLQGQVLKYILRLWLKDNPLEDAKKSRWYLDRLIAHLEP